MLPYRKIKSDKLRTQLNSEANIKQNPCLQFIGQIQPSLFRDFVYIIGDLNKGLNFHHSFSQPATASRKISTFIKKQNAMAYGTSMNDSIQLKSVFKNIISNFLLIVEAKLAKS